MSYRVNNGFWQEVAYFNSKKEVTKYLEKVSEDMESGIYQIVQYLIEPDILPKAERIYIYKNGKLVKVGFEITYD